MTILAAVCLSLYRIDGTQANLSLFITFAAINAVYCCKSPTPIYVKRISPLTRHLAIWDLFMDFSLLQPQARHPFLRDITALKPWVYYVIMVIDPILRFSWIFYAIFTHNTQHSTIVSFATALAEVVRRGLWAIIRVENEHCANVAQYKASRDTPLPYELKKPSLPYGLSGIAEASIPKEDDSLDLPPAAAAGGSPQTGRSTGIDSSPALGRTTSTVTGITTSPGKPSEEGPQPGSPAAGRASGASTFRRRHTDTIGKKSILRVMAEAHKQDFEKRRPPPEGARARSVPNEEGDEDGLRSEEEEEDEDEDDDSGSLEEERMQAREAETLIRRGKSSDEEEDRSWV